ncbi:hypothetical protein [Rhodanobacter aciditrophus]|uniref:hypothetical protein n=1 Tax=Rhodanobacter aciditrophus TaxID=1623218 RepID=UPI003CEFD57B
MKRQERGEPLLLDERDHAIDVRHPHRLLRDADRLDRDRRGDALQRHRVNDCQHCPARHRAGRDGALRADLDGLPQDAKPCPLKR